MTTDYGKVCIGYSDVTKVGTKLRHHVVAILNVNTKRVKNVEV